MAASPKRRSQEWSMVALWNLLGRFINLVVACIMLLTAYLQVGRPDAFIWVSTFLVPAILTVILTVRQRAVESVVVRAVTSVAVGCYLTFLIYLIIRLIRTMVKNNSNFVMTSDNTESSSSRYPSPFDYHEAWECLAVIMVVAWIKFLTITSKENLRESGASYQEVSPIAMLRSLGVVLAVLAFVLASCYLHGILSFVSSPVRAPGYPGDDTKFLFYSDAAHSSSKA
ncbi:uncharacterized protein [Procambarus clarkii]|uniref:uncharacterized protein n=1 Tax=Procambarus clarkii TaxID=6728 RepID=UPI001E6768A4|nr:uncharacterized protein LOC123763420 [Procambarus clarkii]